MLKWVFGADSTPFNKGLRDMRKQTEKFSQNVGGMIAGAIGTTAIIAGFKKVIAAASAVNEQMSKSEQVFGSHSKAVQDWSKGLAKSFGQSQRSALEASGQFGTLFNGIGLGSEQSAKMSMRLVELASDMSSFSDASIDDSLIAIRAGLVGEQEPLRKFGIMLNEAALKLKATEMGLHSGSGALSINAKMMAAYSLIVEKTAIQHGNFALTSEGAANSQRILAAEAENAAAAMGQKLLPQYEKFLGVLKDTDIGPVAEGLGAVVDVIIKVARTIGWFIGAVVGLGATSVKVAGNVGDAFSGLGQVIESAFRMDKDGITSGLNKIKNSALAAKDQVHAFSDTLNETFDEIWVVKVEYSWNDEEIKNQDMLNAITEKRMQIEKEIADIKKKSAEEEEKARQAGLSASEKILELEKEKKKIIDSQFEKELKLEANRGKREYIDDEGNSVYGASKNPEQDQAIKSSIADDKKRLAEIDAEISTAKREQGEEEEKAFIEKIKSATEAMAEYAEKVQKLNDDIAKLDAEKASIMESQAFDKMSDEDKVKSLINKRTQLQAEADAAGAKGDIKTQREKEIEILNTSGEIDSMLKDMSKQAESTISASSLASIGAGGSANLLNNGTIEQQKVDLLKQIAMNTSRNETGTRNVPEPV